MNSKQFAMIGLIAMTAGYHASAQQTVTTGASAVDASARAAASHDIAPSSDGAPDHSSDLYQSQTRPGDSTGQPLSPSDPVQGALNPNTAEPLSTDKQVDPKD
jgi:hypothetical protein